jgi:hypothetical protein
VALSSVPDLIHTLHARIGRNLLRYQSVELCLKAAAPFLVKDGESNDWASVNALRDRLNGQTLGVLVRDVEPLLNIPDGYLDASIKQVVDARNELVHHFMAPGKRDLTSSSGLQAAITYLDQQYQEAKEIAQIAASLNSAVLIARVRAMPERDSELELLLEQLVAAVPENVEIISHGSPFETLWRTTRIVQLLKLAEHETERFQGLTLLARAGDYIRKHDPDLRYEHYGLKKLSHIVAITGLFELATMTSPDGLVSHVAYRSVESHDSSS